MSNSFNKNTFADNSHACDYNLLQNHSLMEKAKCMVSAAFTESLKKCLLLYKETEIIMKNSNVDKNVTQEVLYYVSIEICGVPEYRSEDCRSLVLKVAHALGMNLFYTDIKDAKRFSGRCTKIGVRSIICSLPPMATEEFLNRAKLKVLTLKDIGYGFDFLHRNMIISVNRFISPIIPNSTDSKVKTENKGSCCFQADGKKAF
ncbi:uncharacterized protein TNCT_235011 [Trichonephila clavata]|uniref:Uncharacterized protein n=1 Tax=Trichonephila clavata TaxID=2740835 RepID=A0A8X6LR20_TRICU|nr:uncharacterized protein TNCT_235011 [Trichonephila clavata]